MSQLRTGFRGRGRSFQPQDRNLLQPPPVGYSQHVLLAKHTYSRQGSPEADSRDSSAAATNVHGAIGDRRWGSQSSLPSFGSSDSPESLRAALAYAHSQSFEEEQYVSEFLANYSYDASKDKNNVGDNLMGTRASLQPVADVDLTGATCTPGDQYGATASRTTSSPLGVFVGAEPTFDAPKQGRPITKANDPANATPSEPEIDNLASLLRRPMFSPSHFIASVNQTLKSRGSSFAYTVPTIPADLAAYAEGQNPKSSAEQTYHTGDIGSPFYSPTGIATPDGLREAAMSCSTGQSGEFLPTSFRNSFANGSQDFSVPPPGLYASVPPMAAISPPSQPQPQSTDPLQKPVKEVITCSRCSETHKWPHALPCLHVFCFPCLNSAFNSADQSIVCPNCDSKTSLEDGPCNLKMDGHAARLMMRLNISPFVCTACVRGSEAVVCCTTCMAYLCSECQNGHENMKQFLNHNLAPITKLRRTADGKYVYFCGLHPLEPKTRYCCVCAHTFCHACLPDHQHAEFPHSISTTDEVFPILAERLHTLTESSKIHSEDMYEIGLQGPLTEEELGQALREGRKEINDTATYSHNVTEHNRATASGVLEFVVANMRKQSQMMVKNANKAGDEMKTFYEFSTRTLNYGAPEDTLECVNLMEDAYKRNLVNCSKVTEEKKRISGGVKFTPDYTRLHDVLNQTFDCLSHSTTSLPNANLLPDMEGGQSFLNDTANANSNRKNWLVTAETMPISTWNSDSEKKTGTFIPQLNRCRTRTSFIHSFGDFGRGEYAFTEPSGQAYLKDGSYVICDSNNHRIVHYSASHQYLRTIGQPPSLPSFADGIDQHSRGKVFSRQQGYLYYPNRVAICPITENIIATERPPSHDVQIFTFAGDFVRCFGGSILQHPRGVAVDEEGTIIVIECRIMKLVMFSQDGRLIVSHSLSQDLEFPNDIAVKDRKIFISDNRGHCVHVFGYNAEFLYKIGGEHVTQYPIGVSINHLNQVIVTDNHNTLNITVFDMAGTVLHLFESVTKLAQCHNVAVHPSSLELMLCTKDCAVYFFSYDPDGTHLPASRRSWHASKKKHF